MARKTAKNLTDRELEIMQIIWDLGEARLGDVQDALNRKGDPVAPSTVATQLSILLQKGYLTQSGRHGRYTYLPARSREEATKALLDGFLRRVGLGRSPAFLIQLLSREKLTDRDRAALHEILGTEGDTEGSSPTDGPSPRDEGETP